MAERTSTRNRRNTPQSPPNESGDAPQQSPSRRTTRATRSRSHDISDSEIGITGIRGGRRSARQANVQGPQAVKTEGKAHGRKGKNNAQFSAAQVDPELSIVAEEPSLAYPDLAQAANTELELNEHAITLNNDPNNSSGNAAAFSGTTARNSDTAQDLKNSSAQDMLDTLPDLAHAADQLLRWLLLEYISDATVETMRVQLQFPGSRISKNVKRLGNVLQAQKSIYGDFESYINIAAVIRTLLGPEAVTTENAGWRPEPLLHKANLATLVTNTTRAWSEKFNNEHFDFLESIFPGPFLSHSSSVEDLKIAVEIRTQHFIMLSSRYTDVPNFDPDMILSQVFFSDSSVLKGWAAPGLSAEELTEEHQALIHSRLQDLRQNFSNGRAVDLRSLKQAHPWGAFVTKIIAWSKARLDDIQRQIEANGGVNTILEVLSNQVQAQASAGAESMIDDRTSPLVQLDYPSASEFSHTTSDRSDLHRLAAVRAAATQPAKVRYDTPRAMLIGVKTLRAFEDQHEIQENRMSHPAAPVAVMTSNLNQNGSMPGGSIVNTTEGFMSGALDPDFYQPANIDEDPISLDSNHRSIVEAIVEHGRQRDAAQNKENIAGLANSRYPSTGYGSSQRQALGPRKFQYIDPQPEAQQVAWSESGFSQDVPSTSRVAKRNLTADEDDVEPDPSQDEGFQQDNRNQDVAAKRRSKPGGAQGTVQRAPQQQRAAKRARMTQDVNENVENEIETAVNDYNNADEPPESTLGAYQDTKRVALQASASQPKKVQVRKAWSDEETGTLLDLIEEHGTSWRLLKEIDDHNHNILHGRDQVALKDKARNMKLDFLKAQAVLPANFEFVPLNKIQIQKLHDLGIDYNQDRGRRTTS